MKHEPKTMKAKADLMLKRGSISEKQRDRLHAKADVEIGKAKNGADDAPQPDADATETPAKRKAATKAPVMRGQPLDAEEKDL
jgi:hypothetical protein